LNPYRTSILFVALALLSLAGIVLFGADLGRRALPPQALAPQAAPEPPAIAAPEALASPAAPAFEVVRIARDCRALISGHADPGALVIVKTPEGELGRVTANDAGRWTLVPDLALKSGPRELGLIAEFPGRAPVQSAGVVVVVVPECAPGRAPGGGQVIVKLDPGVGSRVLHVPDADDEEADATGLALSTVDYREDGHLTLTGRARPGTMLQAYVNNAPVGEARADGAGHWHMIADETIQPGVYTLRLDQVAEQGLMVARIAPENRARLKLKDGGVLVQPGDTLWSLAERAYGDGWRQSVIYQANRDRLADPSRLRPGQILILPGLSESSDAGN
jgi:nucleoid-associated protein YgaU